MNFNELSNRQLKNFIISAVEEIEKRTADHVTVRREPVFKQNTLEYPQLCLSILDPDPTCWVSVQEYNHRANLLEIPGSKIARGKALARLGIHSSLLKNKNNTLRIYKGYKFK